MKRALWVTLVVVLLVSSWSMVCTAETIELRVAWWGSQDRHNRTLGAIELFEKKYPDIRVEAEFSSWNGYWERIAAQAAGGNLPDVFQQDMQYIDLYASRDLMLDLNPYVENGVLDLSNVDESFIVGGRIGGELYAVNLGSNSLVGVYDPELYAKADIPEPVPEWTWDEYMATARALHTALGIYADGGIPGGAFHGLQHYLRQHGYSIYAKDGKGLGYDDDELFAEFFNMDVQLAQEGVLPGMAERKEVTSPENELLVTGHAATAWMHSNQIVAMSAVADRPLAMRMMPKHKDQVKEGHYIKPSQFFSVAKSSEHKEAAVKFIDFITNDVEANQILMAERGVPISSKVREALEPLLNEVQKQTFDYVALVANHASPIEPPEPAGHPEVNRLLDDLHEQMLFGVLTPTEAAKEFRQEANRILERQ
ncbi:MAG: extracellular solute-binding protein [Firmicutes bacterium]|jgi:multiple sugar transport system substrate-binding protein|nr:extracellular solute-binding protein [Bacillota bacterium]